MTGPPKTPPPSDRRRIVCFSELGGRHLVLELVGETQTELRGFRLEDFSPFARCLNACGEMFYHVRKPVTSRRELRYHRGRLVWVLEKHAGYAIGTDWSADNEPADPETVTSSGKRAITFGEV